MKYFEIQLLQAVLYINIECKIVTLLSICFPKYNDIFCLFVCFCLLSCFVFVCFLSLVSLLWYFYNVQISTAHDDRQICTTALPGSVPLPGSVGLPGAVFQQASYQYRHTTSLGSSSVGPQTLDSYSSQEQQVLMSTPNSHGMMMAYRPPQSLNAANQPPYQNGPYQNAPYQNAPCQNALALPGYNSQYNAQSNLAPREPHVSFQPQSSVEELFPYHIETQLCHVLDPPVPLGNDWRNLASTFGIDCSTISFLASNKTPNPTRQVLQIIKSTNPDIQSNDIVKALRCMQRKDAVQIIEKYLDSLNSSRTSIEGMNTENSSFDSCTPDSSPDKAPEMNPYLANMNNPQTYQDSPQGSSNINIKRSPPPITSVGNIASNTVNEGSARVQGQYFPPSLSSRQRKINDNQAREKQSTGPSQVCPQEYQSLEGRLEVDGNEICVEVEGNVTGPIRDNSLSGTNSNSQEVDLTEQIAKVSLSGSSDN